uniref:Ground-like domain-containing protein n=1 Tax=Setaria digitata TaxID=48799 RepID=A0A915PN71_9BILA
MILLFLLLILIPEYPALFLGGGAGCNCPPNPPCPQQQSCLPCLQLPPPPPPAPLCLPSLPAVPLFPPQPCGCPCKRKKRSTPLATVATEYDSNGHASCNNNHIRKIILKNLSSDPKISKASIYSELKAKEQGDYVVLCSQSSLSITSDSTNYCMGRNTDHLCYVFQI